MPLENGDLIDMLLKAGVPARALMSCEAVVVGGLLLASRRLESALAPLEGALAHAGLTLLWFDLPEGLEPLERHRREAAMDEALMAMIPHQAARTAGIPFMVADRYLLVACGEADKGLVLETLPRALVAAGYGGLPLLMVDAEGTRSVIHCAPMSESVPSQVLTEESVDELSRLLSSTGSVEEFLNALK